MISFRYHLVSIVAVFAALTIGIVAGSTVVKNLVLDATEQNLERTEAQVDEATRRNAQLTDLLDRSGALTDELPEVFLDGRLTDAPVFVIEAPGLDPEAREGASAALEAAGADVVGRLTLRPVVADDAEVLRLAEALGLPSAEADTLRRVLGERIGAQLVELSAAIDARRAAAAAASTTTTSTSTTTTVPPSTVPVAQTAVATTTEGDPTPPVSVPGGPDPDPATTDEGGATTRPATTTTTEPVPTLEATDLPDDDALGELEDAGLLELDDLTRVAEPGRRLTIVVMAQRSGGHDVRAVIGGVVAEVLGADRRPEMLVAEATDHGDDDESVAPSLVGWVRDDPERRRTVSTVDTLDDVRGWLAVVLAIDELAQGATGHYGDDDGSRRLLPLPS